jgi:hypothetical protein
MQNIIFLAGGSMAAMRALEVALIASLGALASLSLFLATIALSAPGTVTIPIRGQIIGPDNQPLRNVTLYWVADRNDTTRALAVNRTDDDGWFLLQFYYPDSGSPIKWYWLVSKNPIFYSLHLVEVGAYCYDPDCDSWEPIYIVRTDRGSVQISREQGIDRRYYNFSMFANGTVYYIEMAPYNMSDTSQVVAPANFYRPTIMRCYLDGQLVSSVTGNVTIKRVWDPNWVTIVGVPLTNSLYFHDYDIVYAVLQVPETVVMDGRTYRLSNVTIRFDDGEAVSYPGGNLFSFAQDASDVNIYYEPVKATESTTTTTTTTTTTPGGTTQMPLSFWIFAGILVAAALSLIALSRGRKTAMAVMRERRALRATPEYASSLLSQGRPRLGR